MNWALWLVIKTGMGPYETTSQTAIAFETKALCEAASNQLRGLDRHLCFQVKNEVTKK